MSRRSAEKEAVTWTFNLKRSVKDNPSKVSNTLSGGNLKQCVCFAPGIVCSGRKQGSDRWRLRKSSILLFLVWLSGCSSKSFMERTTCSSCALCALCCQASLCTAQPHPHCFLRHKEGAGAGSTSSSAVSLTTNDMEKSSSAGICNHDWLAIGWRLQSQINAQVRQATFWDTHKSSCSGELRQATDRFALVDEEIIEVVTVYEKARKVSVCRWQWCCGHYSGRGWRKKTPLPDSKIRPIGPAWSSDSTVKPQCQGSCRCFHALSAKAGATFTWFCLRVMSREEISMPAKICLSKINWFVSEHRQLSLLTIASRYYHEFKQKLFDVVNYSVR